MLELASELLRVEIDPARGGVIRSIVWLPLGLELLYRAHWPSGPLDGAARGELGWTRAWGGGWNVLFPNAGAPCRTAAGHHPFHGAASATAWSVAERRPRRAQLRWAGTDGLEIVRQIVLQDDRLSVTSDVVNRGTTTTTHLLVEHLILGEGLLGGETTVAIESGYTTPLANEGYRLGCRTLRWPEVDRPLGREDWSTRTHQPTSRYGTLHDLVERRVRVAAPEVGLEVVIDWSPTLPFLWFWEESCGFTAPPWDGRVRCLGLEPASVSTGEGLDAAMRRGEATSLDPGAAADYRVDVRINTLHQRPPQAGPPAPADLHGGKK